MGIFIDALTDKIYETFYENNSVNNKTKLQRLSECFSDNEELKEERKEEPSIADTILNSAVKTATKVADAIVEESLPSIVRDINDKCKDKEVTEYVTYTGDTSEYPSERLELDTEYPIVRLSESPEGDNIFGSSVFRFRQNGPKHGSDIRLEPYYKIPIKFYEDKWGEEIITFTDVLAGYIPLIEKARKVSRNPDLYFGLKIYNNPDSFMLSSLDSYGRMTDDVIIAVSNGTYDISWKKDLNWKFISR